MKHRDEKVLVKHRCHQFMMPKPLHFFFYLKLVSKQHKITFKFNLMNH